MMKNNFKGNFILVSGLDGSGKTTAIIKVLKKIGDNQIIVYLKGVGSNSFWGKTARKHAKTCLFLIELINVTLFYLKPALKKGKIVLMDKYFFFVASHVPDVNTTLNQFLIKTTDSFMIQPDLIIYFQVSLEERMKRLKQGPPSRFHQKLIDNPKWAAQRDREYSGMIKRFKINTIFLDTTGKNKYRVATELRDIIENYLEKKEVNPI